MIIEGICLLIFGVVELVISLLPTIEVTTISNTSAIELLSWGLYFFPLDLWVICIGNIILWIIVQFTWATVEWVYKKIPGVD